MRIADLLRVGRVDLSVQRAVAVVALTKEPKRVAARDCGGSHVFDHDICRAPRVHRSGCWCRFNRRHGRWNWRSARRDVCGLDGRRCWQRGSLVFARLGRRTDERDHALRGRRHRCLAFHGRRPGIWLQLSNQTRGWRRSRRGEGGNHRVRRRRKSAGIDEGHFGARHHGAIGGVHNLCTQGIVARDHAVLNRQGPLPGGAGHGVGNERAV